MWILVLGERKREERQSSTTGLHLQFEVSFNPKYITNIIKVALQLISMFQWRDFCTLVVRWKTVVSQQISAKQ